MNQLNVLLGCRYTPHGLLLEGVQDVYNISKLDRIHGTVSISSMVCNHFECPSALETAQRFGVIVFIAFLGKIQSITHDLLDRLGKLPDVFQTASHPVEFLQGTFLHALKLCHKWHNPVNCLMILKPFKRQIPEISRPTTGLKKYRHDDLMTENSKIGFLQQELIRNEGKQERYWAPSPFCGGGGFCVTVSALTRLPP